MGLFTLCENVVQKTLIWIFEDVILNHEKNWFLNFCLSEFCFQFELSINVDFQMHQTHLKSFVFEIFIIGGYTSTFYLFDGKVLFNF